MDIHLHPIGIIHSSLKNPEGMPIQTVAATGIWGSINIYPEYKAGLKDIDGLSHIILIYYFHLSKGHSLEIKPFLDAHLHGVFATRAPKRPNSIGISIVRLLSMQDTSLVIEDIDVVDGTHLLDIKPYVPAFDVRQVTRIGWLSGRSINCRKYVQIAGLAIVKRQKNIKN